MSAVVVVAGIPSYREPSPLPTYPEAALVVARAHASPRARAEVGDDLDVNPTYEIESTPEDPREQELTALGSLFLSATGYCFVVAIALLIIGAAALGR